MMLFSLLAMTSSIFSQCHIDNASYKLRNSHNIYLSFLKFDTGPQWPSNLVAEIRAKDGRSHFWFIPWDGGSDGIAHLASINKEPEGNWVAPSPDDARQRPIGDIEYVSTDRNYNIVQGAPHASDLAPAHILLPDLGDALSHRTEFVDRIFVRTQFFDLIACGITPAGAKAPRQR